MDQTTGYNKMTLGTSNTPARVTRNDERSIDEIRQNIEKSRSEITETVDQLGEKIKQTVDWRSYIGEYPVAAVGGAAVIGFLVARKLFAQPKRSNTEELLQNLVKTGIGAFSSQPKKTGVIFSVLTLAGKYALDQFQKYQHEAEQRQQQEEQLQALQAYQQMLAQQMSGGVNEYPVERERHRTVGGDY